MKQNKRIMVVYIFLHIILLFYSCGGIFSKLAATETFLSVEYILYYVILMFILAIYAVIWQQIIKYINLTTAYANKGITVIWGIILGKIFFDEAVTIGKIIGAVLILSGIVLVVKSDEK